MVDIYKLGTQRMEEVTMLVAKYFHDERYTDKAGAVWVGAGEAPGEVWIVESGSDEGYMNKNEMLLKMVNEIVGDEEPVDG